MQKRINPGRSYAPVVISKSPDAIMYAHRGFGVFITN